jgi:aspartate aminotransferase
VQKASVAALTGSQQCVCEMRADYLKLRDKILSRLSEIPGITCTVPEGAFYVYPNVSAYFGKGGIQSAAQVAARLLNEAHVVSVPGEAFGTNEHIRLSYAVSHEDVDEGARRMKAFFSNLV